MRRLDLARRNRRSPTIPRYRRGRSRSRRFRPSGRERVNRVVFGNRGTSSENTITPGVCRKPASSRSRRRLDARRHRASRAAMAALAAAPKPAMPATFSVPARRPCSCPPPRSSGSKPCNALGQHQRADALGAADLVRRQRQQIGADRQPYRTEFCQTPGSHRRAAGRRPHGRCRPLPRPAGSRRSRCWPA